MKRCTACQLRKPLKDFCRQTQTPDGRASTCRACQKNKREEKEAKRKAEREQFGEYNII